MSFKTCRTRTGGCGYPFKTVGNHPHAILCDKCKEKKYGDKKEFINLHVDNRDKVKI